MFKRKKKTCCETPEYSRFSMPPEPKTESKPNPNYIPPASVTKPKENFQSRHFYRNLLDTKEHFDGFVKLHDDLIKMDGAEVYFSVTERIVAIVTTQEWKDYFHGISNVVPNEKESSNDE